MRSDLRLRNRILVQDGIYNAFSKRLAETDGAMKVADGFKPGAVIGPLIDMKAVEKVEAHIADAVKKGAKVAPGSTTATPLIRSEVAVDAAARQVQAGFPGHTMNG